MNDTAVNSQEAHPLDSRRKFLEFAIGGFGLATLVGMVYPVGVFLWPRQKKGAEGGSRSMKIPASDVGVGEAKFIRFLGKPSVITRPNEDEIYAMSAICTHLGCVVKWNESVAELQCPCHGGRFDAKGLALGGPVPAPLPSYKATLQDDYIVIEEA